VYNPHLKQYFGGPGAGGSSYINPAYVSNVQYSAASGPGNGWMQLSSNYPTNTAIATVVVTGSVVSNTTGRKLRKDGEKEITSHHQEVSGQLIHLLKNWMYAFLRNDGKFTKFSVSLKKSKLKKGESSNKVSLEIGTRDSNLLKQIQEFICDTRNNAIRDELFHKLLNSSDLKDQTLSIKSVKCH